MSDSSYSGGATYSKAYCPKCHGTYDLGGCKCAKAPPPTPIAFKLLAAFFQYLPAIIPAWLITAFLWHELYVNFFESTTLVIFVLVTFIGLTCLGVYLLAKAQERVEHASKRSFFLFWGYIVGIYALLGYTIAVESEWSTLGTIVAILGFGFFGAGLWSYSLEKLKKKLSGEDEDKTN